MADLAITPHASPFLEHHVRSPYVERYWLPTVGPTTLCLARRIGLDAEGALAIVYSDELLAAQLGVAPGVLRKTLRRMTQFNLATEISGWHYVVETVWPAIAERHIRRLPQPLRAELERVG